MSTELVGQAGVGTKVWHGCVRTLGRVTTERAGQLIVGIGASVLGVVIFALAARSWMRDLRAAQAAPGGPARGPQRGRRRRGAGVRPIVAGAGVVLVVLGLSVLVT